MVWLIKFTGFSALACGLHCGKILIGSPLYEKGARRLSGKQMVVGVKLAAIYHFNHVWITTPGQMTKATNGFARVYACGESDWLLSETQMSCKSF